MARVASTANVQQVSWVIQELAVEPARPLRIVEFVMTLIRRVLQTTLAEHPLLHIYLRRRAVGLQVRVNSVQPLHLEFCSPRIEFGASIDAHVFGFHATDAEGVI